MKTITRTELTKFRATDSVTPTTKFVALGDDDCLWGVGETATEAESDALSELREVRAEQQLRAMSDEDIMSGVTVFEIVDSRPSTKLVADWSGYLTVGIYEDEPWSIRLYEDRAIVRIPYVKWVGQTGTLDFARNIYRASDGPAFERLTRVAAGDVSDDFPDAGSEALWIVNHNY